MNTTRPYRVNVAVTSSRWNSRTYAGPVSPRYYEAVPADFKGEGTYATAEAALKAADKMTAECIAKTTERMDAGNLWDVEGIDLVILTSVTGPERTTYLYEAYTL